MRKLAAGVAMFAAISSGGAALAATPNTGQVIIVHGVRGLVANVDVDGNRALTAFEPERTTDPLTLTAGKHTVVVSRANDPTATPVLNRTITLPAGAFVAAAVGLTPQGQPSLTIFNERGPAVPAGKARLIVRHIAAAPTVRLQLDGHLVAGSLSGGPQQLTSDLAPGNHSVAVMGADGTPVLAPQEVPLRAGTVTTVYLIGSQADNTLTWLARVSNAVVMQGVPTGDAGLAATRGATPWSRGAAPWSAAAFALAGLLLVPGLRRRRR